MIKKITTILFLFFVIVACNQNDEVAVVVPNTDFVKAVDISNYPEIEHYKPMFYNEKGEVRDFISILKNSGVNTIRLRLWVNPTNKHCGFEEVKNFAKKLKTKGFKIWLSVHYSDTWADPSKQVTPKKWQAFGFNQLKAEVYDYTEKIVKEIAPDYIQIGNEINTGFLHPWGDINKNKKQFIALLEGGVHAVRNNAKNTKIIIHFAGFSDSEWFFNQVKNVDYDIIGLSYYPIWHGKSLQSLEDKMLLLSEKYQKQILIAETAYPFTLKWNDNTNNIVGLSNHLILPEYQATEQGQQNFMLKIKQIMENLPQGVGFCYWGAELIAWKGKQAKDASSWENQALFDFNNKALPVLKVFNVK